MEFLFADYTMNRLTFMNCNCWDWTRRILAAIPTVEQQQYQIQNCKNCCTQKDYHFQMELSGSG